MHYQRAKVDTSGMAKAVGESFRKLGAAFSEARAPRVFAGLHGFM